MTDIVEFLTARLDEEEARHRRLVYGDAHWESLDTSARLGSWTYSRQHGITVATNDAIIDAGLARMRETFDNWQRQNAEQWLADVAAKRAILALHAPIEIESSDVAGDLWSGTVCYACEGGEGWPCTTLRHVAAPCAGHPDYNPAWAIG